MNAILSPRSARRSPSASDRRSRPAKRSDPPLTEKVFGRVFGDHASDHALTGAGFADETQNLARRERQVDIAQNIGAASPDHRRDVQRAGFENGRSRDAPADEETHVERAAKTIAQQG